MQPKKYLGLMRCKKKEQRKNKMKMTEKKYNIKLQIMNMKHKILE